MTVKLTSLKHDLDREKKGDWVPYPTWPGVKFKVSALTVPAYETARDLLMQKLQAEYKTDRIPSEILMPRLGELFATHILHEWEGFDEPYSPSVAQKILMDPSYPDMVEAVEWCAKKVAEVRVQFVERDVKNSEKPSART